MPKILENVREQLLMEARRQIAEYGYKNTTIRSVAEACGCGVGTVYNYFESKELLIATFVLEDWQKYLKLMEGLSGEEPKKLLRGIYESICNFAEWFAMLPERDPGVHRYGNMKLYQSISQKAKKAQGKEFDDMTLDYLRT